MKKIILLSLLVLPAIALASGHADAETSRYFVQTGRESDFWPRVINFTIFAALICYLVSNPIKEFFKARSENIASQLDEIEEKLKAAKNEKKEAQARLNSSEEKAKEIIVDSKAEAVILSEKIAKDNENELASLERQLEEKMTFEERKSAREAIDEILSENITTDDINLSETKVIEIISKNVNAKVA